MASLAVMNAVEARLRAGWSRALIVSEANTEGAQPLDGGPYLTVTYPVADETQISVGAPGSNTYREEGAIRFVLSVPFGTGLLQWAAWINELRDLFRGKVFDGIVTWEAPPFAVNDDTENGTRFELSFAVPYRYDIAA